MVSMKNTIYQIFKANLYALSVLTILGIASCSKAGTDEPVLEPKSTQKQLISIPISAEVELDESTRSLVYPLTKDGKFQSKLSATVPMITVIRNAKAGGLVYANHLNWQFDSKTNKLQLKQDVLMTPEEYTALSGGTWYASAVLSGAERTDTQGSGPTALSQRLSYTTRKEYATSSSNSQIQVSRIDPKISVKSPIYYPSTGSVLIGDPMLMHQAAPWVDHEGTSEATKNNLPTIYILPWTKVNLTHNDPNYTPPSRTNNNGSLVDVIGQAPPQRTISFSGSLKPVGTVVRIKLETAPATYEMADQSGDAQDLQAYMKGATWNLDYLRIQTRADGHYDFATGDVVAGQIPQFVYSNSTPGFITWRGRSPKQIEFSAPIQNHGYIYFWTPEETFSASMGIRHVYEKPTEIKSVNPEAPYQRVMVGSVTHSDYYSYYYTDSGVSVFNFPTYTGDATQWKNLLKGAPYTFDCATEYPMQTIQGLKNGHTKEITLRVRPAIKNAQRHTLKVGTHPNTGR